MHQRTISVDRNGGVSTGRVMTTMSFPRALPGFRAKVVRRGRSSLQSSQLLIQERLEFPNNTITITYSIKKVFTSL